MKKRIASTIMISILTVINMIITISYISLDMSAERLEILESNEGYGAALAMIAFAYASMMIFSWFIFIALSHTLCIPFSIRNLNSPVLAVRIINIVLIVAGAFLVVASLIKIIQWWPTVLG